MQSESDDDVRKRLLEKSRFELAMAYGSLWLIIILYRIISRS